VELLLVI